MKTPEQILSEQTGYTVEELKERQSEHILPPDDVLEAMEAYAAQINKEQTTHTKDYLQNTKKGRYLMNSISFPIANHFKTHPEKLPIGLIIEIADAVSLHYKYNSEISEK